MLATSAAGKQPACPAPDANGRVTFGDGSILMKTGLEVNPDGAAASYTPGDHGYTYINNGVNLHIHGKKLGCSAQGNQSLCHTEWTKAEAGNFGPGTAEFCVYAMEVEPPAGGTKTACELPRKGRYFVGNGKGRPKAGEQVPTASGDMVASYLSMTHLTHTVHGQVAYIDSAAIPGLVTPQSNLVGALAWVRYGDHEVFAIVNDSGPAFGEGSVALHQQLRNGQVGSIQPIGPIPIDLRCSSVETGLKPPFVSRPDGGANDLCKAGHKAKTSSDIRAYQGIGSGVTSIILASIKPPMSGTTVTEEVTLERLREWVTKAGFTPEKLHQMATCLAH
ncbi:hypothetical protein X750_12920 [Mesorhizobium sp. LNJC394B00]|nr:hypothetical protein X750_12920 [Mesorhizobium sp. LNJC394B00]